MKNLKSILFSLMAIAMVTVFLTSCETDKVKEITQQTELNNSNEDLIAKLNADEDALAFFEASEELEMVLRETLIEKNISVDELGRLYEAQGEKALEKIFGDTELLKIQKKINDSEEKLNAKFPNLQTQLNEGALETEPADVKPFSSLESEISMRVCGKWYSSNRWKYYACSTGCSTLFHFCEGWDCFFSKHACKDQCKDTFC